MQITLNKANKLYKGLQKHSYNPKASISTSLKLVSNLKTFQDKMYNQIFKHMDDFIYYKNIQTDMFKLKNLIFKSNEETGISDLMNKKELYKNFIRQIESILQQNEGNMRVDEVNLELMSKLADGEEPYRGFSFQIFDSESLQTELKSYKKLINEIDDRILEFNAITKITIDFTDSTKNYLGLD